MIKWIIATIALIGVILNIYMIHWGFACWVVSNSYWATYNLKKKEYALSALFATYFFLAVWGFIKWRFNR